MNLPMLVAIISAAVILVHCICAFNHMTYRTRHSVRVAYGALSLVALAQAIGPFYGVNPSWLDASMLVAVACFLLVNQRRTFQQTRAT